jgi:hypothetical protein
MGAKRRRDPSTSARSAGSRPGSANWNSNRRVPHTRRAPARRVRDAEVAPEHVEGDGPHEGVHHLEATARARHDRLGGPHRRGRDRCRHVVAPNHPAHGRGVGAVLRRVPHAEEEGLAAHDHGELLGVGHPEGRVLQEDLPHVVVAGRHDGAADPRHGPGGPQQTEHEGQLREGEAHRGLRQPPGRGAGRAPAVARSLRERPG